MRMVFYDTKPYDRLWFEPLAQEYGYPIKFFEHKLSQDTAALAAGYEAVCAFVNDTIDQPTLRILHQGGVRLLALRCAGYNNVDFKDAFGKIHVMTVPSYSPNAVAEHAAALLLTANRKTHRAYLRTRDGNFSINGLMGVDLKGKVAGVIGTGKIGRCFMDICKGFGMEVIAYDPFPAQGSSIAYVPLEELYASCDVISLHCPLTKDTRHIINREALAKMRPGVILINTSRGALVDTGALIDSLKACQVGAAGLDVYEEESQYFFEDFSNQIIEDDELARLLSLPNVVVTSHQGFFTKEAMRAIAKTTLDNVRAFAQDQELVNEVCYQCNQEQPCPKKRGEKRCFP